MIYRYGRKSALTTLIPIVIFYISIALVILYLLFFIVWIIFVRVFQMSVIAIGGHLVSIYTLPIMIYTK